MFYHCTKFQSNPIKGNLSTDKPTYQWTDGRTKPFRIACPQLERNLEAFTFGSAKPLTWLIQHNPTLLLNPASCCDTMTKKMSNVFSEWQMAAIGVNTGFVGSQTTVGSGLSQYGAHFSNFCGPQISKDWSIHLQSHGFDVAVKIFFFIMFQ